MRLQGKVAVITGAANGMGAAAARVFAREGAAAVVVTDVLDDLGAKVVAEIEETGGRALYLNLDVTDEGAWVEAIASVLNVYGRLDVLVNNAGISASSFDSIFDTDGWNRLMAVNSTGVFYGCKHGVGAMQKNGGGSIVNMSSVAGVVAQVGAHVGYSASKGAVRLITKAVAVQHAADGIRANSVHPGLMPPMITSGKSVVAGPGRAKLLAGIPMGRAGEVTEVAAAVLFLASDESSYITGAELMVDGGWTAM